MLMTNPVSLPESSVIIVRIRDDSSDKRVGGNANPVKFT